MRRIAITFLLMLLCQLAIGQKYSKVLLVNGFLHVGNGETMQSALIGVEDGKISLIKNAYAYTYDKADWDTIIELDGRHIYPGFVAPNSTLGITEIDAVRATRDYDDVGTFNPHVRSQIGFNVESKVIATVRTNGVLISQTTPRGGTVSGSSSIMKLDGWNWEDATIRVDDGVHVNWPSSISRSWRNNSPTKHNKNYKEQVRKITDFFDMAKAYASSSRNEKFDQRLEAMRRCFKGKKRVYIHANELQQLNDIIEFSIEYNLKFPVIVGGYDAHLITRKLKDAKIPVMLRRPHKLPMNESDDVDFPFKLPALLHEGGVKFCIQNAGGMEAMNARNIPFLAGTAMSYGLSEEDAVSAVSLWSCEILGINKSYGSIEKGKSATLFVSDGSALDMLTNNLFVALVDGQLMSLNNHQKDLYIKYSNKYKVD